MKKRISFILLYYIIGFVIFNFTISVCKLVFLKLFKGDISIIVNELMSGYIKNTILYTLIYFLYTITIYIYDKMAIKRLNEELNKIKERRQTNDK